MFSHSQTRMQNRLASLLLIGALACYALWLIALTVRESGYRIEFGSKKKAAHALSLISLARWRVGEKLSIVFLRRQINEALILLRSMAFLFKYEGKAQMLTPLVLDNGEN
jgi:hypothetical protein